MKKRNGVIFDLDGVIVDTAKFQIYYGKEILMDDSENPGDHGLKRAEFPSGWNDSEVNAFTGEGFFENQAGMQEFLKTILNYRKNSKAIYSGETNILLLKTALI